VTKEFLLRVSYLEIYNETIRDLLNPSNDNLKIHQDKTRGVYVTPLTEEVVTCSKDVLKVIQRGEANRHISSTDYNLHSSRSHTLFQMVIESRERSNASTTTNDSSSRRTFTVGKYGSLIKSKESVKISQLNLIDLAGSEKAATNEDRRKEGPYINKSLLTLGTVISKLTDSSSGQHIPFRDSKLTRILQTALSGQAKVAVICTISPSLGSLEESVNTLKFASRVKKITIHAKNEDVMDDKALLQKYRGEIIELKQKLQDHESRDNSDILKERQNHAEQLKQMRNVRNTMKERIDHLTRLILTSNNVGNSNVDSTAVASGATLTPSSPHSTISTSTSAATSPQQQQQEVDNRIIVLQNHIKKLELESREKDNKILCLEQRLKARDAFISKLETELSITKAELEVNQMLNSSVQQKEQQSPKKSGYHGLLSPTVSGMTHPFSH
jgi:hypothetical protein